MYKGMGTVVLVLVIVVIVWFVRRVWNSRPGLAHAVRHRGVRL